METNKAIELSRQALISKVAEYLAPYRYDPLRFVCEVFPWGHGQLKNYTGPDEWQVKILTDLTNDLNRKSRINRKLPIRYAVASGNGIGKGALTAWLTCWGMSVIPMLRGVVTANTQDQLRNKTWAEVGKWYHQLPDFVKQLLVYEKSKLASSDKKDGVNWFIEATPFNKENPEAFQGIHADDILIIFDEASPIPEEIWRAVEGALTTDRCMFFAFGNPTRNKGQFKNIFTGQRHRWNTRHIDGRDCKMTNKETLQEWIDDYGEDSDFVRVKVKGQFPKRDSGQFIPEGLVETAKKNIPAYPSTEPLIVGVDIAIFGDDQSVIIGRRGNYIEFIKAYAGLDTIALTNEITGTLKEFDVAALFIDSVGVGVGVVDNLTHRGIRFEGINGGSSPDDKHVYKNKKSEMWGRAKKWLETGWLPQGADKDKINVGISPNYAQQLSVDLSSPEYSYDANGLIILEPKKSMKRRGQASPDFGDAFALTFAHGVENSGGTTYKSWQATIDWNVFRQ